MATVWTWWACKEGAYFGAVTEGGVDGLPRPVQIEAMKVDDSVGLDRTGPKLAIPGSVERGTRFWPGRDLGRF